MGALTFLLGFFVGGTVAFVVFGLIVAASNADRRREP
jgi:hypothetical protein